MSELQDTINTIQALFDAQKAQLPEGMEDCTIVYKKCSKGHGRLTATNWIDHGCQTCVINDLRNKIEQISVLSQ